ncbi:MAG TPA: methyltransferase domain-containing protein [Candidatus Methylomirabilis sp.]|nr:methyltransferase domain-containing protein [Candidatus Methylomirabilis sp.]
MAIHNPLVFFKRFLASPVAVGAVLPTSHTTARVMAKPIDPNGRVLEMGAGTGSITQGILERLTDPTHLTSVEIDTELANEFRKNFPNVNLVVADAEDVLRESRPFNAIVSGVPFTVMDAAKRERMFDLIKRKLSPNGVFVAIQYSLTSKAELERNFRTVQVTFSPLNIPPAAVYVCREPIIETVLTERTA